MNPKKRLNLAGFLLLLVAAPRVQICGLPFAVCVTPNRDAQYGLPQVKNAPAKKICGTGRGPEKQADRRPLLWHAGRRA
jgi:hypothetical protein